MAGKNERDLIVRIIGDARQMKKATKEAESGVAAFEKAVGQAGAAIAAAFAGGAILSFAKQSVTAALEDQRAQQRLAKTLQNVTAANKDQVAAVEASIAAMQRQFAVADDELRPAFETIVRATKDVGQAQQLLKLALDISAGSGKNLQDVSVALVKAMGGQTRGLKELGITLKDTEGKALSADEIFSQLRATFAGQADELANSQVGKLKAVGIQYEELKETVGMALLPALTQLADIAQTLFGWFNSLDDGTQKFIAQIVVFGGVAITAVKAFTAIKAAVVGMNLSMAATPWGAIAAGISIVAGAFMLSSGGAEKATTATEDYVDALKASTEESKRAVEAKVLAILADENVAYALEKSGVKASDAAAYILGYRKELQRTGDEMVVMGKHKAAPLSVWLDMQKYALEDARIEAERLKNAETELGTASDGAKVATDGLTGALVAAEVGGKTYMERLEDLSQKMWSTGETASSMARSIINAVSDIRAQFDKGFAADKALADFKASIKTLEDDLRNLNANSAEYRVQVQERADSALNLAETYADAALAARKMNEAERAIAKNQLMINRLNDVRNTLDPNSPLRKYLDEFIDQLLKIPGTYDARVNVTVAGMPGIAASDYQSNNFGLTPEQIAQMLGKKKPSKKRAAGGPVMGGEVYLVGEQGPEVFVAGQSGQIIPNHALGGGSNITINVTAPTGTDPYTWGNAIVSALKSYVRVNGKIAGLTV
jgi:hypothetical protein